MITDELVGKNIYPVDIEDNNRTEPNIPIETRGMLFALIEKDIGENKFINLYNTVFVRKYRCAENQKPVIVFFDYAKDKIDNEMVVHIHEFSKWTKHRGSDKISGFKYTYLGEQVPIKIKVKIVFEKV